MRKTNPETRAKKAASAVNQVKVTKSAFTYNFKEKKDELVEMLKKCECPYPVAVAASLVNHNLIKKESGLYTFMTDTPIHFSLLINDLNRASKNAAKKNENYLKKVRTVPADQLVESPKLLTDEELIMYLKNKGYRILRPVTNFEEC